MVTVAIETVLFNHIARCWNRLDLPQCRHWWPLLLMHNDDVTLGVELGDAQLYSDDIGKMIGHF